MTAAEAAHTSRTRSRRPALIGAIGLLLALSRCCLAAEALELKPFTLWQLKNQTHSQMMSYVIRSETGKVIVIDGGMAGDAKYLSAFLAKLGDHVSAWFLTHPHDDHMDALTTILRSPGSLQIDALYASMPDREWMARYGSKSELQAYDRACGVFAETGRAVTELQLGQEIVLDGLLFEVLGIKNPEITANPINNQSILLKLSGAGRTVLFTGDLGVEGGRKAITGPYATKLHADYVQMAHHGQNGVNEAFYQHVGASRCLWPTPLWLWDNDKGGGKGSGPWRTLEVRAWMDKPPAKTHYVGCKAPELID
jgi:beta-lactamase superfamily II metal-dependent hydrolase